MNPRVITRVLIVALLVSGIAWVASELNSTTDALSTSKSSLQDCQVLREKILSKRAQSRATAVLEIDDGRLYSQVDEAIRMARMDRNALKGIKILPNVQVKSIPYVQHLVEIELSNVAQAELLAFIQGIHTETLPLMASQIRFETPKTPGNRDSLEAWDVKLLLTYFVRSAKSSL